MRPFEDRVKMNLNPVIRELMNLNQHSGVRQAGNEVRIEEPVFVALDVAKDQDSLGGNRVEVGGPEPTLDVHTIGAS